MRIAIIGGGFYGCVTALALCESGVEVVLFERHSELLRGAIMSNQHRLHLGFHYPRCDKTINQAIAGFSRFVEAYPSAVKDIEKNIYCVHKKGFVSGQGYAEKMLQHGLAFESLATCDRLKRPEDIELVIKTGEKMLDLARLRELVLAQVSQSQIILRLGTCADISVEKENFDWVINCTYTDPGAGCDLRSKSELAVMLLLRSSDGWRGKAITIMDGPFCSIYPAGEGLHTLSSVVHTPAIKAGSAAILEKAAAALDEKDWDLIEKNIWDHAASMIDLDGLEKIGRYVTVKTKIENDENDFRGTVVFQKDNVISVMAGKISCAFLAVDDIKKILGI